MIPSIEKTIQAGGEEVSVLVPQNAVQMFDAAAGLFTPLATRLDALHTVSCALRDATFSEGIVMDMLSGGTDWYRVPTVEAIKSLFPDTELTIHGTRRTIANVVQERTDSPLYARFAVRTWAPGRKTPVLMTLDFPAVRRGVLYVTASGACRLWRDTLLADGTLVRSLGALILRDLSGNRDRLLRRAEYLTDQQIRAGWQSRINRVAGSLYLRQHKSLGSEELTDYESAAARDTIRLADLGDQHQARTVGTIANARLAHVGQLVGTLISSGEIASPLHTSAGAPCSAFYRPWSERSEDRMPVQLWKHPLSVMVNPARMGVLAGDMHCLPLANGSHHRVVVDGFPHYGSVNTRDLLGVACDLPCVLGDGLVISESAADDLAVDLETWKMLSPDELINLRAPTRHSSSSHSRLRGARPTPIFVSSLGGPERKWRVMVKKTVRPLRVGDKLQSGIIKGVVNRILPEADMPKVVTPDGSLRPADIIFSWRHWQKWGALSEVCRAQLAYWCADDENPLVVKHGEISTLEQVQSLIESAGGSRDLALPVIFGSGDLVNTYAGYFPVGVREQLSDIQSQESHANPMELRAGGLDASILTPDRVSTKGVRLGYADVNCLMDDYPEMTRWLLGYSSDAKLKELAKVLTSGRPRQRWC